MPGDSINLSVLVKRFAQYAVPLGIITLSVYFLFATIRLPYPLTPEFPLGETAKVEKYLKEKMFLRGPEIKVSSLPYGQSFARIGKVHEFNAIGDGFKSNNPQCVDLVLDSKGNLVALGGTHTTGGSSSVKIVLDAYLAMEKQGAIPAGKEDLVVSEWWNGSQRYVTLVLR